MERSDIIVLGSFLLVLLSLFGSFIKQKLGRKKDFSSGLITISFALLFLGFGLENTILAKSLISGIIAGSLFQPLLADPYLTKRVLFYRKEGWCFIATPWWMVLLWGLASTHLIYLFLRVGEIPFNSWAKYPLLIVVGSIYFYIFELFVNNLTFWWERRNCWQPFRVAFFATLAEITAVGILLSFSILLIKVSLTWRWTIIFSIQEGILIAIIFRAFCYTFYKKEV